MQFVGRTPCGFSWYNGKVNAKGVEGTSMVLSVTKCLSTEDYENRKPTTMV